MEKKDVGHLFDGIAGTYDKFNHLLSLNIDRKWRKKAVSKLTFSENLLDVAAGTADLSIEILRQHKSENVTGIDISLGMIDIGKKKIQKEGLEKNIVLQEGSALDMVFKDSTFDAVTCAYGVRNFSDLDKGLSEMYRVLRTEGQLMILEFSYPSNPFIRKVYDLFFSHIMPVVGKAISKNAGAYTYFRESVKGFIWGRDMVDRIAAAGFKNVRYKTLSFGITTIYLAEK